MNGHVWNDVFLSECIHSIPDMLVVHSEKFHPGACAEMMGANRVDPAKVLDAFSLHKVRRALLRAPHPIRAPGEAPCKTPSFSGLGSGRFSFA